MPRRRRRARKHSRRRRSRAAPRIESMRRIAGLFLLLFSRVIFGCDAPHGFPLSDVRYVPDCGMNSAALAVSDDGAFAAWHFMHAGFGFVTGTNYGAPLDAKGRATVDVELPFQCR